MRKECFNCGCKFNAIRSDQLFCSKSCRYKYYHNSNMVMTLKKKWFDMILSGVKTEDYREIKSYWEKRFTNYFGKYYDFSKEKPTIVWNNHKKNIVFRNGYGNDKPEFTAECTICEGFGNEEWGAVRGCKYYILKIHRVYNERKCSFGSSTY